MNLMMNKATLTIEFDKKEKVRAIMIYDSSNFDYALKKIDDIKINNKHYPIPVFKIYHVPTKKYINY